jgi:hypothetical protein
MCVCVCEGKAYLNNIQTQNLLKGHACDENKQKLLFHSTNIFNFYFSHNITKKALQKTQSNVIGLRRNKVTVIIFLNLSSRISLRSSDDISGK